MRNTTITYTCDICGRDMGSEYWTKLVSHSEVVWGEENADNSWYFCKDCARELWEDIKRRAMEKRNETYVNQKTDEVI